ncbi:hypothetical protein SAMN05660895_0193 [Thermoflavifilum thermophilum]|uniref:Uncharacterized protein n=1 Tax=Thermoflavifilum thermophilum TaxID=1393122 RepID=A0A1I7MZE7_9BACT|nr:hypothetical protein SAMN05660895_0193 [Thermoflavifilum thermophilum]
MKNSTYRQLHIHYLFVCFSFILFLLLKDILFSLSISAYGNAGYIDLQFALLLAGICLLDAFSYHLICLNAENIHQHLN